MMILMMSACPLKLIFLDNTSSSVAVALACAQDMAICQRNQLPEIRHRTVEGGRHCRHSDLAAMNKTLYRAAVITNL